MSLTSDNAEIAVTAEKRSSNSGEVTLLVRAVLVLLMTFGISVTAPTSASAHGGGLDGDGGHNCYVSYCAGTYHCHQPRGPRCQALSQPVVTSKPLVVPSGQLEVANGETEKVDEMGLQGWLLVAAGVAFLAGLVTFWNWARNAVSSKLRGIFRK